VLVSSPNEPGQPGPGDRPANGEGASETPPWQAGARRPDGPVRPAAGPPANPRASRYVTGLAAPDLSAVGSIPQRPSPDRPDSDPLAGRIESRAERTEITPAIIPSEAYPSELPDLSGPMPKAPATRRPPVDAPARSAAPTSRIQVAGRPRGPVRASMQIRRIDPWSMLKVSGLLSVALFFVWMIAVAFLYLVLGAMGVWSKLNSNVGDLLTSGSGGGGEIVSAGSIFGGAALVGLVNIVLLTAMATVGAYIYNLSTDIVGGVEVTLADLD
jgi:hypothetical protein